jgi:hypothetical protein
MWGSTFNKAVFAAWLSFVRFSRASAWVLSHLRRLMPVSAANSSVVPF